MSAAPGSDENFRNPLYSSLLLGLVVTMLFAVPAMPVAWHGLVYNVLFSAIFFCAALSLIRRRTVMVAAAAAAMVAEWLAYALDMAIVMTVSRVVVVAYFVAAVVRLIAQIARTRIVTTRTILESINGYLLLGVVFAVTVMIVQALDPQAFTLSPDPAADGGGSPVSEAMYFAFVTFTTLGYGDFVPRSAFGRAVAVAASICGQIYLTVIIAMLVGKFLGRSRQEG